VPASVAKQALTAVCPVLVAQAEPLAARLAASADAVRAKLRAVGSLHFARFALLGEPDTASGPSRANEPKAAQTTLLLFETTFDGDAEVHLAELWAQLGPEFEGIFEHCRAWPLHAGFEGFRRFLRGAARPSAALFAAHAGLTVERVRADARLRSELVHFLDAHDAPLRHLSPVDVVVRAREAIGVAVRGRHTDTSCRGGSTPNARPALAFGDWISLAVTGMRSLVHDAFDVLRALWHDAGGRPSGVRVEPIAPARLGVQLCFSHVARAKPGRFRRAALRLVLRVTSALASAATFAGRLAGGGRVHSARWVLLDDERLVFFCNHDGSFAAVLGAAVERVRVSAVLSMIWSQTLGFPPSFGWFVGGARDETRLREFARAGELSTPLWYSAYPELAASEIDVNAELRALLSGELDAEAAERLLALVRD
jgi:hypothetical protein